MVCVAVTRGGWGDVWLFDSREVAFLHPLVQYGDAILSSPADVCHEYNSLEWNNLRYRVGLCEWYPMDTMTRRQVVEERERQAPQILEALTRRAQPAPTDPAEICRIVAQDRRSIGTMARKNKDAPVEQAEAAPKAAKSGGNLPVAVRGPKGVPLDSTIHFLQDKDGRHYSATEHNPKKPGSGAHAKFSNYREGMTVQQALDAGIPTGDLVYDRGKNFIEFRGGTVADASVEDESEVEQAEAAE